jgi:hypothetical protein
MTSEEEIASLKRIIEEERQEKLAKKTRRRVLQREYSHTMRHKNDHLVGRPRPETCEICARGGIIVFEHCHKSNKFRGWVCQRCNAALGMVNDDIVILEKLIVYLKAHQNDK